MSGHTKNARYHNQVRIIGGLYKRRVLPFPSVEGLRPTPDRVRETVFNWLGQTLTGQRCLDLFAGTGAFGFEAISRGAQHVLLVEKNAAAFQMLKQNTQLLQCPSERFTLLQTDSYRFVNHPVQAKFDVIFVDPPYADVARLPALLSHLQPLLQPEGKIYLESPQPLDLSHDSAWDLYRQDKAGMVHYALLTAAKTTVSLGD